MIIPNFFIAGAPRCGTTAMSEYLKAHPDIAMAAYKEPHFFGRDLQGERFNMYRNKPERYRKLFDHVQHESCVGEGSVAYLFSETAASEIHVYNPNAKIIIMLRHPVEALYSMYHQALFTGSIHFSTFEEMLTAHRHSSSDETASTNQRLLSVDGVKYGEQVARYYKIFDREQVHIILYDNFSTDTPAVYRDTLQFLGVDPDFQPANFAVINARQTHRNTIIGALLKNKLLQRIGLLIPNVTLPVYRAIKQLNAQRDSKKSSRVDRSVADRLLRQLRPDIERLSILINRDLSHWLTMSAP
jgi:hypothetical protein